MKTKAEIKGAIKKLLESKKHAEKLFTKSMNIARKHALRMNSIDRRVEKLQTLVAYKNMVSYKKRLDGARGK